MVLDGWGLGQRTGDQSSSRGVSAAARVGRIGGRVLARKWAAKGLDCSSS